MKKYTIIICLVTTIFKTSFAQWQWAKQIGSDCPPYDEKIWSLITDGTNSYVCGPFYGCLYLQNDTLYSNGTNDLYIVKYDENGSEVWSKSYGGNYNQLAAKEDVYMVYDSTHHYLYLAGRIIGTVYFGGGITLYGQASNSDIFLAKMDLNGNFIWAEKAGGNGEDNAKNFIQPDGNILLGGKVADTAYFGSIKVNPGGYFARYDTSGNCIWAEQKFSGPEDYAFYIDFIATDLIMSGSFDLSSSYVDTTALLSQGSYDGFLTRMDSVGQVKWLKTFGSTGVDVASGISIDNTKSIYLTGGFEDTISVVGQTLINSGPDILIAKLDEYGNSIWVRQTFATGNNEGGINITSDDFGNSYIIGVFSGNASFGPFNISTSNSYDMFLARYDSSGSCLGVRNFGQGSGSRIAVDNSGNVICGGYFQDSVNIGSTTFVSIGGNDLYIAKSDEITGIEEGERRSNQLLIYANPSQGTCNVTIPDEFKHEKKLTLSIYDNTGKLIQQGNVEMNEDKVRVNLEAEAKGIYNVTLSNGKKSYGGKIVFE